MTTPPKPDLYRIFDLEPSLADQTELYLKDIPDVIEERLKEKDARGVILQMPSHIALHIANLIRKDQASR